MVKTNTVIQIVLNNFAKTIVHTKQNSMKLYLKKIAMKL